ncbi:L-lactate permease [Naumannella halotolerans]|uniref:L-lactate permease n=1 Tax=Naumannella halotolerans TaxID=993414 RepID=UPI00370D1A7E
MAAIAAAVIMLRFWKPQGSAEARERLLRERIAEEEATGQEPTGTPGGGVDTVTVTTTDLTTRRVVMALFPYLLVIAVFSLAKLWTPLTNALAATDVKIPWPGLHGSIVNSAGEAVSSTTYTLTWLSGAGSLLLICGVITAIVYRVGARRTIGLWGATVSKLRFSILTVGAVLGLAYVMNQSGQTITIGTWIAGTGAAFAFLSPILGWLGTAVTGSDTSANALFATLQQAAAERAGLDPTLLVAANTSGGVVGKMISPQNLAIAATAVGLVGRESEIFRKVIGWSIGLLLALCLLVGLQSSVLSWMLP